MTPKPTAEEIGELLALAEKATPRPWRYSRCYGVATIEAESDRGIAHAVEYVPTPNADYLVAAANLAPKLAREVERLKSDLEATQEALAEILRTTCDAHIYVIEQTEKALKAAEARAAKLIDLLQRAFVEIDPMREQLVTDIAAALTATETKP